MILLDIGCGQEKAPDCIGVDIRKIKGMDILGDIQHLPFKDQSVDKILCLQLLEHINDLIKSME